VVGPSLDGPGGDDGRRATDVAANLVFEVAGDAVIVPIPFGFSHLWRGSSLYMTIPGPPEVPGSPPSPVDSLPSGADFTRVGKPQ
jgi:hypothetical protein